MSAKAIQRHSLDSALEVEIATHRVSNTEVLRNLLERAFEGRLALPQYAFDVVHRWEPYPKQREELVFVQW